MGSTLAARLGGKYVAACLAHFNHRGRAKSSGAGGLSIAVSIWNRTAGFKYSKVHPR
jgi:hypothetical protein